LVEPVQPCPFGSPGGDLWVAQAADGGAGGEQHPPAGLGGCLHEEFEVVSAVAAGVGLTPTGYVASTAVAVARGQVRPVPSGVGDVVRELVEARAQLVRYGVLLNQAVARLNATGQVDGSLVAAAQRCDAATASVRAATERLGRRR
jgi:hypothetical protein